MMEGASVLYSPTMWISIIIIGLLFASINYFFQTKSSTSEPLLIKPIVRDGILGSIFAAMTWVMIPETMTGLTKNIGSVFSKGVSTISTEALSQKGGSEFDLQVGPPSF